MEAMIAAYLIGWIGVAAYVGWISVQNRRIAMRLEELQALVEDHDEVKQPHSKAA